MFWCVKAWCSSFQPKAVRLHVARRAAASITLIEKEEQQTLSVPCARAEWLPWPWAWRHWTQTCHPRRSTTSPSPFSVCAPFESFLPNLISFILQVGFGCLSDSLTVRSYRLCSCTTWLLQVFSSSPFPLLISPTPYANCPYFSTNIARELLYYDMMLKTLVSSDVTGIHE
jgi:hypothetical protein